MREPFTISIAGPPGGLVSGAVGVGVSAGVGAELDREVGEGGALLPGSGDFARAA